MSELLLQSPNDLEKTANYFQHFLITRINIDWNISRPISDRNDLDFLDYRFKLFEQTCYPSVNAQTNQNFIWLLLLDADLPSLFREQIERYVSQAKIKPVFIVSQATCLETLREVIDASVSDSTQYVITTNLDSDDVICNDFIATVQNQFREQNFEFINFPFGYLYRFEDRKLYLREWLQSPVYTLIEKKSPSYDTALKYAHNEIANYKIKQVFTKPMWLMTAHGKNVRTRFDVSAAWQPLSRLGDRFSTKIDFPKESLLTSLKKMYDEVQLVITSKSEVNTTKVKTRKIINIFFPSLIRLIRKTSYNS